MASLKTKGDLAELKVAADLIDRGCRLSIPFGEDCDYDLIADYEGRLHRVQVKYTRSDGQVVVLRCRSHSLTKGKVRATKLYTSTVTRSFICGCNRRGITSGSASEKRLPI